jgi:hypothetical protein
VNLPPTLDEVAKAMLTTLSTYLPSPGGGLPVPTVSMAKMSERSVGIGRTRGGDAAGPFPVISRKGIRLDAVARFQLWAADPTAVDDEIGALNAHLMAKRDQLRKQGFLRLALETTPPADVFPADGTWRRYAEYSVLYEFDYEDTDGAGGIIARIPVTLEGEFNEEMFVTDEMMRWDNNGAPPLLVRGPFGIDGFALLAFVPGPPPAAGVTLRRTFDGATGSPKPYATLADFLAAVSGPNAVERHAQVAFASFSQFLAAFPSVGAPIPLGGSDYRPFARTIDPAIELPTVFDRFEFTYNALKFNQPAVVYLRATNF